jgi:hypothetical protein
VGVHERDHVDALSSRGGRQRAIGGGDRVGRTGGRQEPAVGQGKGAPPSVVVTRPEPAGDSRRLVGHVQDDESGVGEGLEEPANVDLLDSSTPHEVVDDLSQGGGGDPGLATAQEALDSFGRGLIDQQGDQRERIEQDHLMADSTVMSPRRPP